MLADHYHDLPARKIAAVVTHLEMHALPPLHRGPEGDWSLRRVVSPDLAWFRALYRRIGENWLWYSRLVMPDADLAAILRSPQVEVYALESEGHDEGLLELDFRTPGDCELAFFGVTAPLIGSGAGRWLMNRALERAWSAPVSRVWVHTCSFDHPSALAFYQRSGFLPFRRQIEIVDDPRLAGILPLTAAPHVPVIGTPR
ncbi:GNAT family N-acetyltransferase [Bradyrhizobium sp. 2TAF24]|uniref:GNAT family N-acetyltransferase n=1 Tax=Bradyrhizobium sp. 2TAF24 TaxID=3233011 RepID=UPI003F913AFA